MLLDYTSIGWFSIIVISKYK